MKQITQLINRLCISSGLVLFVCLLPLTAKALTFELPANGDSVVGQVYHVIAKQGDNFNKIARRYDIGYYSLVEANPKLEPNHIEIGKEIIVPARFVLPLVPRTGIVVNLAELRLYYYPPGGKTVETYPVGIGREGWNTPVGLTKIVTKDRNPTWYAPESIRAARAAEGVILPKMVPPGPENPLGGYRMRLAITTGVYLMHGTNDASGVGRRSSSGCIRIYPEDVERLFEAVKIGTGVNIINDPYKLGWLNDKLYLEAHLPLEEQLAAYKKTSNRLAQLVDAATKSRAAEINWNVANRIAIKQRGVPYVIGIASNRQQDHSNGQLALQ